MNQKRSTSRTNIRRPTRPMHDRARRTGGYRPMARPMGSSRGRLRKRKIGRKILFGLLLAAFAIYGWKDISSTASDLVVKLAGSSADETQTPAVDDVPEHEEGPDISTNPELNTANENAEASGTESTMEVPQDSIARAGLFDKLSDKVQAELSKLFKVREVRLNGTLTLSADSLSAELDSLRGMPMFDLEPPRISKALCANPRIQNAYVSRSLPGAVTINIEERREIALLAIGDELWALDEHGMVMPLPGPGWMLDLPIITGAVVDVVPGVVVQHAGVRTALEWMCTVRKMPRLADWLVEVHVTGDELGWIMGVDGRTVFPGNHHHVAQLATLDAYFADVNGSGEGRIIDLTYPDFLIVRDEPVELTLN